MGEEAKLILPPNPGPPLFSLLVITAGVYGLVTATMPIWAAIGLLLMAIITLLRFKRIVIRPRSIIITQILTTKTRVINKDEIISIRFSGYTSAFGPKEKFAHVRLANKRTVMLDSGILGRNNTGRLIKFLEKYYADKIL